MLKFRIEWISCEGIIHTSNNSDQSWGKVNANKSFNKHRNNRSHFQLTVESAESQSCGAIFGRF